jgi:hypothetical protein
MRDQDESSITTAHHDGCAVLVVRGHLDELTAGTLDGELARMSDSVPVVVDLHCLGLNQFADSGAR